MALKQRRKFGVPDCGLASRTNYQRRALSPSPLPLSPPVSPPQVDTRKELEASLKSACNAFILHATSHLAEPIATLLQKARAFLPTSSSNPSPPSSSPPYIDPTTLQTLSAQAFLQPARLEATLLEAHEGLLTALPALSHLLSLYLDHNNNTKAILFRPVRQRILTLLQQLRDLLGLLFHTSTDVVKIEGGKEGGAEGRVGAEKEERGLPEAIEGLLTGMTQSINKVFEGELEHWMDGSGSRSASAANSPTRIRPSDVEESGI